MTALSDLLRQISGDRAEPYDELLKRSSLLRSFDTDIYDRLLSKGLPRKQAPAPSFKTFIAHRDVAPLSSSDGEFYIKDQRRKVCLSRWLADPEGQRDFSKRLVRYYQERDSPIDVFAQRIFADPSQALKDFRRLYGDADKRFDLAMCETLLRILRNRSEALGPALTRALNDREEYFQSRSRFADDWARTTHFLPRESLTREFERFLQGRKRWIFHLHAAGGIGKTAYLRWLISRYCVIERGRARKRIPVARIDFDHVHLAEIDRAPWLVLLPIAEQLSVQLPGNPFKTFLKEFGEHQRLVDRPAGRSGLPFSSRETPVVAGLEKSALDQFTDALGDRRVLLVFDTLEEIILHHGATLISMLNLLGLLHARRPEVWVILSGRYDIRERDRFAEVVRRFGDRMVVVAVKPFTRAQSLEYLVKMRGLRPDASVRSSDLPARGNPFKLALFADLIGRTDTFSREDLRRFPKLEINYLIERIIERIPDDQQPLRWTLRYAVIPHDLTKEFLVNVLGPHLEAEMSRRRSQPLDHPLDKLPEGSEIVKEKQSWKQYKGAVDYDKLWNDLLRYQSPSGWIIVERKIPKLQPEIVVPMRQLLQTQDIFDALQHDAAIYFDGRAEAEKDPHEWANMTTEAIYHRFHLHGAVAAEFWEQCLRHPNAGDPEVRRKIIQAVLSGDFLGEDGKALPHVKTGTIMSRETLAKAYFELASIDAQEAQFADTRNTLMRQAQQNLNALARIERSLNKQLIPLVQRAFVEASVEIHAGHSKSGLLKIEQALAQDAAGTYRIPLLMLKADTLLRSSPAEAGRAYDTAVSLVQHQAHPPIPYSDILRRRAYFRYYHGNLRGAADDHLAAIDQLKKVGAPGEALLDHLRPLFTVARTSADPQELDEVIRLAKSIDSKDQRLVAFAHRAEIYGLIDQYRMLEARTSSLQLDGSSAPPETDLVRGTLEAIFFDFDQALESFGRAESEWKRAGRPDSAAWCRLRNAQIAVENVGNLHYARTLLSRSQSGQYFPAQTETLILRQLVRSGTPGQARKKWRALCKRIIRDAAFTSAEERLRAFASALAMELEERSSFAALLTMLARLEPSSARFSVLRPFRDFYGAAPEDEGLGKKLMGLLSAFNADDPNSANRVLLVSDALRFLGDRAQAASMLDAALKATPRDRVFMRRQLIKAQQRLDVAVDDSAIEALISDVDRLAPDCGQFRSAVRLEQAEWWIKKQQYGRAKDALPDEPREQSERSVRYWLARAELARHAGKGRPDYFLRRASVAARKLGLPLRLHKDPTAPRRTRKDPLGKPEDVLQIEATQASSTIRYFPAEGDRLASASHSELLANILAATDSTQVATLLTPWQKASQGLADLFEFLKHPPTAKENTDLCIVTADSLAGIPWEWALARGQWRFVHRGVERGGYRNEASRWFQAILNELGLLDRIDGVTGPRTVEALQKAEEKYHILQADWGGIGTKRALRRLLPRAPVMLIGMPAQEERSQKRGYGSIGIHLEKTYQESGVDLIRADMERLGLLRPPTVIHITLNFIHTVGEIRLGTGSFGSSGVPPEFTARMLTRLIGVNQGSPMKPFAILDPWHPGHPIELSRQQYLRNAFACELLQLGGVRGVLAAGLVKPDRTEPYLRGLIGALHEFESAGAIAARLGAGDAPAALFTEDPTIPVI